MLLFLYGSLLDPATLARRSGDPALPGRGNPALLAGRQRAGLAHAPFPTLRRKPRGRVKGLAIRVPAAALRRLNAYEGPAYRLTRVVVATPRGKTAAWTWIAPGGTRRPWNG